MIYKENSWLRPPCTPPRERQPPYVEVHGSHIFPMYSPKPFVTCHSTVFKIVASRYDGGMSVNEAMVLLKDVREFSVGAAEFIALEVASGASVKELHENHEEMVPSPLVVNRWRRNVPAFDLLMQEAEQAKAQGLADEVISIAGDEKRQAAVSGNMIKSRQWLSGQLSEQFRNGPSGGGTVKVDVNVRLTDDQLMQIASEKFNGTIIEGEKPAELVAGSMERPAALEAVVVEDSDPQVEDEAPDGQVLAGADGGGAGEDSGVGADQGAGKAVWDFLK